MKHTNGPWIIDGNDIKTEDEHICHVTKINNVKLVAAAPEMLKTLIEIMRYQCFGYGDDVRCISHMARRIVEKVCYPENKLKLHDDFHKGQ